MLAPRAADLSLIPGTHVGGRRDWGCGFFLKRVAIGGCCDLTGAEQEVCSGFLGFWLGLKWFYMFSSPVLVCEAESCQEVLFSLHHLK